MRIPGHGLVTAEGIITGEEDTFVKRMSEVAYDLAAFVRGKVSENALEESARCAEASRTPAMPNN